MDEEPIDVVLVNEPPPTGRRRNGEGYKGFLGARGETSTQRAERYRRGRAIEVARAREREDGVGFLAECVAQFPGGMKTFLPLLRQVPSRDESLTTVVETFLSASKVQNGFRLEEMCVELGVSPHKLLGVVVEILSEQKSFETRIISYLAMPQVMKRNAKQALTAKGVEDRKMFLQANGILPTSHGSTINVTSTAQAAMLTSNGDPSGLPSFEEHTVNFSEVVRNAMDSAPPALPEPIDAVTEEE